MFERAGNFRQIETRRILEKNTFSFKVHEKLTPR